MVSSILAVLAKIFGSIFAAKQQKAENEKDYKEYVNAHQEGRANAGDSATDFDKNMEALKASIAKKKDD